MIDELKPCPFCGGQVERDNPMPGYANGHGFRCPKCNACFELGDDDIEAAERWNTRHERTCKVDWREDGWGVCECGGDVYESDIFCSGCGAKVASA